MANTSIWIISLLTIAAIIVRPYKLNEAIWAIAGALALLLSGLIFPYDALKGVLKGTDVYFFLTGMMLLAETCRQQKLFDWLASSAVRLSRGSPGKLFLLVYITGVIVTVFLSNDATAVVLTPAVAAATKKAAIKKPLPFLFICAFIANAASFVLPISNPAKPGNLPKPRSFFDSMAGAIFIAFCVVNRDHICSFKVFAKKMN